MIQKLFQDPAGTIPAILAGQPVGLIKRAAGDRDVMQATALSKPTLGRWPMTGRRMLQSRNVFDSIPLGVQTAPNYQNGFGLSSSSEGVTVEVLERGYEDGEPFIVAHVFGTSTNTGSKFVNVNNNDFLPLSGNVVTVSAKVTLLAGALGVVDATPSLRAFSNFRRGGVSVNGTSAARAVDGVEREVSIVATPLDGLPVDETSSRGLYIRVPALGEVDATIKVKALQSEAGSLKTQFQTVYSPNDITEPNVKDLWHLYNDGGDSLNCVLPAGTYGFATLDLATKLPTIDTIVSDGTTPINVLRHERQIDEAIRAGAFSVEEARAITEKWARAYG